jgi:hypothetical protein
MSNHVRQGRVISAAALLLTILCLGSPSNSTQLLPMSLKSVAQLAKLSYAGTVSRIEYRRAGKDVVTDVHFADVRLASGRRPDVKLTVLGGIVDGQEYGVVGMPRFECGKRYIILAADTGTSQNSYMPIIGLTEGVFRLLPDPRYGSIVHDLAGRPLVAIRGNHVGVLGTDEPDTGLGGGPPRLRTVHGYRRNKEANEPAFEIYPPALDPGTRVMEEEFLGAVERLSAEER